MALNQVENAVVSYRQAVALDSANSTLQNKLAMADSKIPKEQPVVVIETPIKVEAAKAAEKKRKTDEASLAEENRKLEAERKRKEAEQRRLAELEQKRKEAELVAKFETSLTEVGANYSNASLVSGSTY